jgi:hypothetical protein
MHCNLKMAKRTREEFSAQTDEIFLQNACDSLKPLDLDTFAPQYLIPIISENISEVDPRNALYTKPNCIIRLEDAPDGLPHLLIVERSVKVSHLIESHLGAKLETLRESMGEEFCEHITSIDRALHTKSVKVDLLDGYFLPEVPLNQILGNTVLARLLNGKSPRQKLRNTSWSHVPLDSAYSPSSPVYSPPSPGYAPQHFASSPAYAPTHTAQSEGKDAQLAKRAWLNKQKDGVYLAINIGAPESHSILSSLPDTLGTQEKSKCLCYRRHPSITDGDLADNLKAGIVFLREDISSIGIFIPVRHMRRSTMAFDIRRILLGLSTAAKILHRDHHSKCLAHCDLTPTNILVLSDSFLPIDSMSIPFGAVAPGGTLEWSAPEQILYRPVSDKTDVYSLALLVVALLGGSMFGQISEYIVASKPQNLGIKEYTLDTVKLLPMPELTLGSFEVEVENTGLELPVDRIRNTLRTCLQLDPSVRPTILELADSLIDFAHSVSVGPECVCTLGSGFGDGNLHSWTNEDGILEYFWRSTYRKNNSCGGGFYR